MYNIKVSVTSPSYSGLVLLLYQIKEYLVELAGKAYELFKRSELEERRQLIKLVLSNLRIEGKKVRYEVKKPFDTIIKYANHSRWLPGRDSNPEYVGQNHA